MAMLAPLCLSTALQNSYCRMAVGPCLNCSVMVVKIAAAKIIIFYSASRATDIRYIISVNLDKNIHQTFPDNAASFYDHVSHCNDHVSCPLMVF